jgi:hypothetical protein
VAVVAVVVVVAVEEEVVEYLDRTDCKELSIHTQGNNSIAMAEAEVVEYIQDTN